MRVLISCGATLLSHVARLLLPPACYSKTGFFPRFASRLPQTNKTRTSLLFTSSPLPIACSKLPIMGGVPTDYDDSDTSDSDEIGAVNGRSYALTSATNDNTHASHEDSEDLEDLLKQWKRSFPSRAKPGALSKQDLITFLSRALTLVTSGEEIMEDVIMVLATEGGLTRLRQLIPPDCDAFEGAELNSLWRDLLLVYFRIMSHDTVLESEAVDRRHGILMSDLHGDHGKRGYLVFKTAARGLLAETKQENIEARTHQENVETSIAVLSCMLSQLGSTNITADVRAVTGSMVSLLVKPYRHKKTDTHVRSILAILDQSRAAQVDAVRAPTKVRPEAPSPTVGSSLMKASSSASAPQGELGVARKAAPATFILTKPSNKPHGKGTLRKQQASSPVSGPLSAVSLPLTAPTAVSKAPLAVAPDLTRRKAEPTFNRHDNDKVDIKDIMILPTLEEILSGKRAYLPAEDPSIWHKSGMAGVIDRHFRLVREDTVGQLVIATKKELVRLQNYSPTAKSTSTHSVAEIQGARTNVYHDVALDRVLFSEQKGMQFILSLIPPPAASQSRYAPEREAWWKHEQRLGPGSLICLISSHGGAHFLLVHSPPPPKPGKKPDPNALHKRYTLGMQPRRAFVIAELASTHPHDASAILRTLSAKGASTKLRLSLIEFPGQILQSFAPTLAALQHMSVNMRDIPFVDALTPDFKDFKPSPPAYSRVRNFKYQLQALLPEKERGLPGLSSMESILKRSILDEVQRDAVKHSLTNELALIQGPPGTGKSFTGVKIIEALLENKRAANLGPIVCVCFTNHALDQLLEHLMDAGVSNVIRMGSRSKSERLAPLNIREVALNYSTEGREGVQMGRAKKIIKKSVRNVRPLLDRWYSVLNSKFAEDAEVTAILARDYPALHEQLLTGSTMRGHFALSPVQEWLNGGSGSSQSHPDKNENAFRRGAMFAMPNGDRKELHQKLLACIFAEIYHDLEIELLSFYYRKGVVDEIRGEVDLRALSDADVIGVTTSGLAGKHKRLRKLRSKVVVVEEAGEVLEAHLLTAMLPSIQHAVLIGDHQQLRPKVNNYDLSIDNPCSKITLDVSLFERLVSSRFDLSAGLPYITLEMQRRMHPSISHLIRSTLYPNLVDAPNVHSYPPVAGMAKRMFWLDHRNKEDETRNNPQSDSQSNKWEVGMVAALVGHLQKQGVYAAGDIAVLTPYSGQLKELQAKLGSTFGIMLSERDLDEGIQATRSRSRSHAAIRLSTVDAFQGEEAKVIIISMVRSNDKKICGFLGTKNRINVLLSRAMHGMYIIGNSSTTSEVLMWQHVVHLFKAEGNFGPALEIACGRHPNSGSPVLVREPRDFSRVSPEAGCNAHCGEKLPCGHSCSEKCHSDAMHNRVKCKQQCGRIGAGCGHPCQKACGEDCEPNCKTKLSCNVKLPCGHRLTEMYCFQQRQKISDVRCRVEVERDMPGCGHKTVMECYITSYHARFHCKESCAAVLACGHSCGKDCIDCRPSIAKVDHGTCVKKCGHERSDCGHNCLMPCHGDDTACPPCNAPCQSDCTHMKCNKRCSDLCLPCTKEKCSSGCPHSSCTMPCAAPCDLIPCSKRCKEKLPCGHACPSICGEICPTIEFCRRCAKEEIKSKVVDPITKEAYEDVAEPCLFLPCGHFFTVSALDRHQEMAVYYEMNGDRHVTHPVALKTIPPLSIDKPKSCPTCRGSLRTISRYGRIVRRALLDRKTQEFIDSSHQSFAPLAKQLQEYTKSLSRTLSHGHLLDDVSLGTELGRFGSPYQSVLKATGPRYTGIVSLRLKVRILLEKVQQEELPFRKVREMVDTAGRRRDPEFDLDQNIINTSNTLLKMQMLFVRCELAIAADLVNLWEVKGRKQGTKLSLNLSKNRKYCEDLLASAIDSKDIYQQIEAKVFWAHFLALDCAARLHDEEQ